MNARAEMEREHKEGRRGGVYKGEGVRECEGVHKGVKGHNRVSVRKREIWECKKVKT